MSPAQSHSYKTATNDSCAVIVGKGQLEVEADDGGKAVMEDVYFCPKANTTIISPGALIKKGAKIEMNRDNGFIIKLRCGKKIFAAHKDRRWFIRSRKVSSCCTPNDYSSKIYVPHPHPQSHTICAMKSSSSLSKLWHARLGHVSMKRIKKLFRQNEAYGLPDVKHCEIKCDDCYMCKSVRTRSLGGKNRNPGTLEVVVTDVAGPFTPCLTGEKLMVTFRDVSSTYSEVCIIQHKSEVHQGLVNVVQKWEQITGLKIKTVRSDRGGEYISGALDKWLKSMGITHEFSNPHKPEQNGNAERLNRTLGEMARTLLASSKLSHKFWNFAYLTAAYIHHRLPNSVTGNTTPYEIFHKQKPNLDILRSFGAIAFLHVHQGQRRAGKLEDRARKFRMVGYVEGGKGWMFYDEKSKTVFPSAIAKFPYEAETEEEASQSESLTSLPSDNNATKEAPGKGSIEHIINALRLGDFTEEMKIDRQDVAASHALQGDDFLKLLKPPRSYAAAMRSPEASKWKAACDAEMSMMDKMKVWKVIDKPDGLVPIDLKWVFTYKKVDDEGNPIKFKARLVAKGFKQKEGIDYYETFAPTATFAGLRILLTIAALNRWPVHSFDITSAYLHSEIDSHVYFSIPTGYMCEAKKKNKVLEALKALYGTKQGARCWWKHIDAIMVEMGFKSSQYDQSLYIYRRDHDTCIIWLHSDDAGVMGSSEALLEEIHEKLKSKLLVKWETNLDQIVGVTVKRFEDGSFSLSQPGLTKKLLKSFLPDSRQVKTPMNIQKIPVSPEEEEERVDSERYLSAIGTLNYLSVATRSDITYTVNYLARFSSDPRAQHWQAIEHLIRYLNTTGVKNLSIQPIRSRVVTPVHTYVDANWGGEGARSSHGFITFFLNCPISWTSKRQTCVASSTCHAEYMALGKACRDAVWIRNLIEDLQVKETLCRCIVTTHLRFTSQVTTHLISVPVTQIESSITSTSKYTRARCFFIGSTQNLSERIS